LTLIKKKRGASRGGGLHKRKSQEVLDDDVRKRQWGGKVSDSPPRLGEEKRVERLDDSEKCFELLRK